MSLPEEDAKTKWCPFTRVAASATEWHTNRPSHADVDRAQFDMCVGSACMAWRTAYMTQDERKRHIHDQITLGRTNDEAVSALNRMEEAARPGYCGLAGKP